jgi:hypothetical protein
MTTENFYYYMQNRLFQTSPTGGQRYRDTSPFSIPWPVILNLLIFFWWNKLETFCQFVLALSGSGGGGTQTLDLAMMRQVFYHCATATATAHKNILTEYWRRYFNKNLKCKTQHQ